jgi:hypothetical protein
MHTMHRTTIMCRWNGTTFSASPSSPLAWARLTDTEGRRLPHGEHPGLHWNRSGKRALSTALVRFLRLWLLVWNGYDGRVCLSSAPALGGGTFSPPIVLVEKKTEEQKNWWVGLGQGRTALHCLILWCAGTRPSSPPAWGTGWATASSTSTGGTSPGARGTGRASSGRPCST